MSGKNFEKRSSFRGMEKEEYDKLSDEEKEAIKQRYIENGKNFYLNDHIIDVISGEPFFGIFSRNIDKKRTKNIPTAGVKWDKEKSCFSLSYNPYFLGSLENNEIAAVLKHEFYHCIFMHVTDRLPFDPKEDQKKFRRWNLATDCAINSLPDIKDDMIEGAIYPENYDLPDMKSADFYMSNLPEDAEKQDCPACGGSGSISKPDDEDSDDQDQDGESCCGHDHDEEEQQSGDEEEQDASGGGDCSEDGEVPCPFCNGEGEAYGQFDVHDWSQDDSGDSSIAESEMKKALKDAMDEARKSNEWGNTPQSVKEMLDELFTSQIDWKRKLKYFIQKTIPLHKQRSIRKISRKYPWVHSGKKRIKESNLAVCIDQSGSVDNVMLAYFFAELNSLAENVTFTVIPFDATVAEDEIFEWKKGQTVEAERVSNGGTDFDPPTKYVNEDGGFDGAIFMTDMYAPKPGPCVCQRLWVRPQHCEPNFNTEEMVIPIDLDRLE